MKIAARAALYSDLDGKPGAKLGEVVQLNQGLLILPVSGPEGAPVQWLAVQLTVVDEPGLQSRMAVSLDANGHVAKVEGPTLQAGD